MSKSEITEKILSDAVNQKNAILEKANSQAEKIVEDAKQKAKAYFDEQKQKTLAECKDITEKSLSACRLEEKKLELAFKNEVVDEVYQKALEKLKTADRKRLLKFFERLIEKYAQKGDVITFAKSTDFTKEITALKVYGERNLSVSGSFAEISGGFILSGAKSDTVLSFENVLAEDKAEHLADMALGLFKNE